MYTGRKNILQCHPGTYVPGEPGEQAGGAQELQEPNGWMKPLQN